MIRTLYSSDRLECVYSVYSFTAVEYGSLIIFIDVTNTSLTKKFYTNEPSKSAILLKLMQGHFIPIDLSTKLLTALPS